MAERRVFVGVRLSPAGIERLKRIKTETGRDLSEIIRCALKHGLDAAERELKAPLSSPSTGESPPRSA